TWDDFLSAAEELTVREGARTVRYGVTDANLANPWMWIWQNEGEAFDQSVNPSEILLTEPATLEALKFYFSWVTEHQVAPPPADLEQAGGRQELFLAGRVAMLVDHRGPLVPLQAAQEDGTLDFEFGITELPQGKVRATQLLYAGYSIAAASEAQDAAWTFLKWISGPEAVPIFIGGGNALPALVELAEDPELAVEEPFRNSIEYARFLVSTPHWGEISSPISEGMELIALGELSVEEGAEAIKAEVDPILQG
ncbi:MAG TPA: extracellular solute-binding protein, partial [Chloroflexota bacterium]|nr:extracellular solute-binding protein [Chloroflexota bacterium]